jgi:hypothetical protein
LKYHSRIGLVKGAIIRVKYCCPRLESSVQFVFVLPFRYKSLDGINWICPVKIKNLLSIELCSGSVMLHQRLQEKGGGGAVALPSAKDRVNTSSFPGSIARLTCLAMVRSEECFISAG